MIVSASYRTDIPALYGRWFANRLAAGHARVANPYGGPPARVALDPEGAEGFVFWTRNVRPFRPVLAALARHGRGFVVQHSLTGYPRAVEPAAPPAAGALAQMREVARAHGPRALVWRYDPILAASFAGPDWHAANFARLAEALAGATDEVVVSFVQVYAKTRANLDRAARRHGFAWEDPDPGAKRALLARLAEIARGRGMRLTLCSQPELLIPGVAPAACIDAARLSEVAGRPIAAPVKGNRPGCLCAASRDIGAYDSCTLGCAYCYAVRSPAVARTRRRRHDPQAEFLIPPGRA